MYPVTWTGVKGLDALQCNLNLKVSAAHVTLISDKALSIDELEAVACSRYHEVRLEARRSSVQVPPSSLYSANLSQTCSRNKKCNQEKDEYEENESY
eukprot:g20690.t1